MTSKISFSRILQKPIDNFIKDYNILSNFVFTKFKKKKFQHTLNIFFFQIISNIFSIY